MDALRQHTVFFYAVARSDEDVRECFRWRRAKGVALAGKLECRKVVLLDNDSGQLGLEQRDRPRLAARVSCKLRGVPARLMDSTHGVAESRRIPITQPRQQSQRSLRAAVAFPQTACAPCDRDKGLSVAAQVQSPDPALHRIPFQ